MQHLTYFSPIPPLPPQIPPHAAGLSNSWGCEWGEAGYARIEMTPDGTAGACGLYSVMLAPTNASIGALGRGEQGPLNLSRNCAAWAQGGGVTHDRPPGIVGACIP